MSARAGVCRAAPALGAACYKAPQPPVERARAASHALLVLAIALLRPRPRQCQASGARVRTRVGEQHAWRGGPRRRAAAHEQSWGAPRAGTRGRAPSERARPGPRRRARQRRSAGLRAPAAAGLTLTLWLRAARQEARALRFAPAAARGAALLGAFCHGGHVCLVLPRLGPSLLDYVVASASLTPALRLANLRALALQLLARPSPPPSRHICRLSTGQRGQMFAWMKACAPATAAARGPPNKLRGRLPGAPMRAPRWGPRRSRRPPRVRGVRAAGCLRAEDPRALAPPRLGAAAASASLRPALLSAGVGPDPVPGSQRRRRGPQRWPRACGRARSRRCTRAASCMRT
jgi:hypothetical protein